MGYSGKDGKIILDGRQREFLAKLFNPAEESFGSLAKSAQSVGFANTPPVTAKWLKESFKENPNLLKLAEKNLTKVLKMDVREQVILPGGEVMTLDKIDSRLLDLQLKVSQFIAKTLGREIYHEKLETENKNVNVGVIMYPNKKYDESNTTEVDTLETTGETSGSISQD